MTTPTLRPYQQKAEQDILQAWSAGHRNVLLVAPTGAGKTVTLSDIIRKEPLASVAIAHRQELVSQMSLALARNGVRHRVIGSSSTIKTCVQLHRTDLGISYYDAVAPAAVAGVDSLIRMDTSDVWFRQVSLWIVDEAHHLAGGNKWHKASEMFPNARGLGVTATPVRADGQGLGAHADGVFHTMVQTPGMRTLIESGYLTDYRIFAPPSDLDLTGVGTSAGGDYSPAPLRAAVHQSHITGDVIAHYLRIAPGKLGVTFAVDVESANELASAFRAAGVSAECVSAKTPDLLRHKILRRFAAGDIRQLVNVDLFGEGFDLPAIEVCSMARPTQSYGLFCQQFGRALRPMEGKDRAIIIDHVGNTLRHGLPDAPRVWTLDRRQRRAASDTSDVIPVRNCPACTGVYERTHAACPYCGHQPEPSGRGAPDQVDGDLAEMTPDALARLRGAIANSEQLRIPLNATPAIEGHLRKVHRERMAAQEALRNRMALWGGQRTAAGEDLQTAQRRFFLQYGIDVATAQTLNTKEANELMMRIVI